MVGRELQRRTFESVAHALRYFLDPLSIEAGGIFAFGSSTNRPFLTIDWLYLVPVGHDYYIHL
ncbi:MAG TPA: hypothetical protein DEF72_07275 [Gammaproteobacteria bacterium]|nr:hypothetical protein [Gammaproteobacteria bacterium]